MWDTKCQVNLGCTWGERLPAFQSWELSERPTYPLSQCLGFHTHVLGLRSAGDMASPPPSESSPWCVPLPSREALVGQ